MKNKIGILNFQYSDHNYGAVLQASALEHFIKKNGYETEHINLVPPRISRSKNGFVKKIKNLIKSILGKSITSHPKVSNSHVFEDFRIKWLTRSEVINKSTDLNMLSHKYNSVIVGSDQVWRPSYTREYALSYFLNFCPDTVRRISYAASFGIDKWIDNELTATVKKELNKFHSISVREQTGVEICKTQFSIEAKHVLDPTLLVGVEFFENIIGNDNYATKYSELVYYKLGVEDKFLKLIDFTASQKEWVSENIYYYSEDSILKYNKVEDWLSKIKKSKFVVTDSFHCVCFSILFEKEFIYYPNESKGLTRLKSLLGALGLDNRICFNEDEFSDVMSQGIDFISVNKKLEILRLESSYYLLNAIKQ